MLQGRVKLLRGTLENHTVLALMFLKIELKAGIIIIQKENTQEEENNND